MEDGIEQNMSLLLNMNKQEEYFMKKPYITILPKKSIEINNPTIGEEYYITNSINVDKNNLGKQLYFHVKYEKDENCFVWDYCNDEPTIIIKKKPIFISIFDGNRIDGGDKLYNII